MKNKLKTLLISFLFGILLFGFGSEKKMAQAPFFGCVSAGEWLCACEIPDVGWQALECSLMEDKEGKQKWIDQCGGDAEKAKIQWLWDMAKRDGRVDPTCCGGQNVCGSLLKPTQTPIQIEEEYEEEPAPEPTIDKAPPPEKRVPLQPNVKTQLRFKEERSKKLQEIQESVSIPEEKSFSPTSIGISLPKVNLIRINNITRQPLGTASRFIQLVMMYDKKLEDWINIRLKLLLNRFL